MVNKNVLSCLLKDGKEVNAVMLVGRLFHAQLTELFKQDGQNAVCMCECVSGC